MMREGVQPFFQSARARAVQGARGLGISSLVLVGLAGPTPTLGQDDAALRAAAPGEWLSYGRDYQETRYSPLDQIDVGNVSRLGLAWSYEIPGADGQVESTPLASDGVLYTTSTWSEVYALDARTGELRWVWDPAIVRGGRAAGGPTVSNGAPNRGVALYDGKVYVGLLDGRLVALDAETGKPVWSRQTTPYGGDSEYIITGAPRIVKGKVIIGNSGAEYHGVRGYVTAYDAESGDQVWRFYTVPGDPSLPFESPALEMAAKTWSGEWWKYGGGGTAWDSFSYDPEADLLYVGTGNGSPWSHHWRSAGKGDNLFLDCILALDPDTGELVWYYQTVPADNWDYTSTSTMTLVDLVLDGRERKVLMQAPKNGFLYVLDRLTGELLSAEPISDYITWASGVDLETGRPIQNPEARYDENGSWVAPSQGGSHNWHPTSWHPRTGLLYIPGHNTQGFFKLDPDYVPVLGEFSTGTLRNAVPPDPIPPQPDPAAFLLAWDPVQGRERWRLPYDVRGGGTLATGENLVFSARRDGWIYAHDASTGEVLWKFEVGPGQPVAPMTYELDGRQYVSIVTGPAGGGIVPARVWTFVLDGTAPTPR